MSQSTLKQGVTQWRGYTLLLLTLVYTFSVLDRFILGILLPQIKQELLLNDALLGLLTGAAFAIFYASLGLPIARLADRYGRKHIIAICLAIFSVMTAVCGMANSFLGLFLARVGVGIGEQAPRLPPLQFCRICIISNNALGRWRLFRSEAILAF